ncbi:MAG: alpha/beta hydrolase [Actinomycetota bacterium]|nr:alpha/beta hydrolase [Actinomycetota bacterium]
MAPVRRRATSSLARAGAVLFVAAVLASCGGAPSAVAHGNGQGALPFDPPPAPVAWHACAGSPGERCGTVPVPVDYAHPRGPEIDLAVAEHPATDPAKRVGALVFNPGGPGESGVQLLPVVVALLPPEVVARFDVIGFDERGTGQSDAMTCGPSPAQAASATSLPKAPGDPLPAAAVYRTLEQTCAAGHPGVLASIDTTNAAHDLDRIRQALGERRLTFLGLSYGTLLGAAYAALFPHHVRAMVLDGAVVPGQSLASEARAEAPALEASLRHFFATCAAEPACPAGPDPAATYAAVHAALAAHPLPPPGNGDTVPVTVGDLDNATLYYLSLPALASSYPSALVAAEHGNGQPLAALSVGFWEDLDGASLVGPQWAYLCQDAADHPGPEAAGALATSLHRRYPLLGAFSVTVNLAGCTSWPRPTQPVVASRAAGAPPILVIGNKLDPNTPFSAAVALARQLASGVLVEWEGYGHTWLLNGSTDACMRALVSRYLVAGIAPANGTRCP